jgi:GT2 family glycosyltransferase
MARAAFEADDRRVVDATLGGALEVFPKVDFEDVVGNRQPQERSESPESGDKNATEPAPVRSETTSPSQPLVTIGIVSWNSASDLPACLEAIHAQDYPNLELIAVDNASEDGSIEVVVAHAPEAQLVKLDENRGYGAGHNLAIGISHGEYYLALNPDVVMKPAYVSGLVEALEKRPDYGSAMGKLWLSGRESAGTPLLDGAGLFIDRRRHQYLRGHGQADRGQFDTSEEIFGVDGAAPLYRRQALQDLEIRGQIFDETYFIHMEDVDLSWRARLLGWRAWYEPRATAFHDRTFRPGERAPVPKSRRRDAVKNRYVTICKNEAPETWRRDWLQILTYDARILGYILLMEQSSLGAYTALFSQRKALREWRASIWARVKVLPEERQEWFG